VTKAQQEADALRQGNVEVAKLQEQLAQAREEIEGLKNQYEDVEILQQQLRRSLRQVVELQHQVMPKGGIVRRWLHQHLRLSG
jgi:archaellum component FlaC